MILAQQLIDASKDGGAAFIAFSIMVFLFAGSLFYMDRVRAEARRPQQVVQRPAATAAIVSSMSASVCARLGKSVSYPLGAK